MRRLPVLPALAPTMQLGTYETSSFPFHFDEYERHLYAIGSTGTGKTTLIEHIFAQHVASGEGVTLVDFHGDLARKAVSLVPLSRRNDLIYISRDTPVPLNVISASDNAPLTIANIVNTFVAVWGATAIGPRSQAVLRNTLALARAGNLTFLDFVPILQDAELRARLLSKDSDKNTRNFWDAYDKLAKKEQSEWCAPIVNKLDAFLHFPFLRDMLCAQKCLDFRRTMDERRVVIVNMSQGLLSEEVAKLLATLIVSRVTQAALSRADVPLAARVPHHLIIDEAQNAISPDMPKILSEARKYRLTLSLFHQYISQLSPELRAAIFGNVGTFVAFRVGQDDTDVLAKQFDLSRPQAFSELKNFTALVRPLEQDVPGTARLIRIKPPPPPLHHKVDRLIRAASLRFPVYRPRLAVQGTLRSRSARP